MLSEFGPVPYTPAMPYTRAPVSDAWQMDDGVVPQALRVVVVFDATLAPDGDA